MSDILEHVAREMATEAYCFGLSKISYENSEPARKDAWKAIAAAGILALRDVIGPTMTDRILAPEVERA
jgi:hypothetical protein